MCEVPLQLLQDHPSETVAEQSASKVPLVVNKRENSSARDRLSIGDVRVMGSQTAAHLYFLDFWILTVPWDENNESFCQDTSSSRG